MRIRLKLSLEKDYLEVVKEAPLTIEQLASEYKDELPYTVLLANVNNRHRELWYLIEDDCTIELYDIRTACAEKTYKHSLVMLYLKAAEDVLGEDEYVTIENSLNQGFYSNIRRESIITEEEIEAISTRMQELIDADIPFEFGTEEAGIAARSCAKHDMPEKARLISSLPSDCRVEYYKLCEYRNFFYGYMVPSTRYINIFELRKYRNGVLLRFPNSRSPEQIPEYRDDYKVYEAYADAKQKRRKYDVFYLADLNDKIRNGQAAELIRQCEDDQQKEIVKLADRILESGRRIVMIAGPSSAGKTTFAKKLCSCLQKDGTKAPLYLGTDDYFFERGETPLGEDGQPDFEGLRAIDIKLFEEQMNMLMAGEEVDIPEFDFVKGKKVFGNRITRIDDEQLIVIEGIHCLNDELSKDMKREDLFKIYISPLTRLCMDRHNGLSTTDVRMLRRMIRDNRTRNYTAAATLAGWQKVRNGEEKYIFPYSNSADAVFNTSMVYEVGVLKKYAEPLLREITARDSEYGEARRMLYFLEPFAVIRKDDAVPANSLIREFIGGQKL